MWFLFKKTNNKNEYKLEIYISKESYSMSLRQCNFILNNNQSCIVMDVFVCGYTLCFYLLAEMLRLGQTTDTRGYC